MGYINVLSMLFLFIFNKKNISKEILCKQLGWNPNTPIIAIFASNLTGGVFVSTWSLFRDRLSWLRETLLKIKNN